MTNSIEPIIGEDGRVYGIATNAGHAYLTIDTQKPMLTYPRGYVVPFEFIDLAGLFDAWVIHIADDVTGETYWTNVENILDYGIDWDGGEELNVLLPYEYWFREQKGREE